MLICPHCKQEGISVLKKSMVLFTNPPCCKICGKPSSIKPVYNWLAAFAIIVLLSTYSALDKGNWNSLLFFIFIIGLNFFIYKILPLVALDEIKVKKTKNNFKTIQWLIIVAIALVYFWGF